MESNSISTPTLGAHVLSDLLLGLLPSEFELPRVPSKLDLFDLEDGLAELFGRRVDLVSKGSVHRLMRESVLADAVVVYAA